MPADNVNGTGQIMTADERKAIRQSIIEGCCEMRDDLLEMANEWEATDDELWRSFEPETTPDSADDRPHNHLPVRRPAETKE